MTNSMIVKKSNDFVKAHFKMNITEVRLFTLLITKIHKDDHQFIDYILPIREFIETYGNKNKNVYNELNRASESLLKKIVTVPIKDKGKLKLLKTSLISSLKYNLDGSGIIEVSFHPDLKPYLLQLKSRFLKYDFRNILNLSSTNSIRIYELLKSFEGLGKRTLEVVELKEILGLKSKYVNRYSNFKAKVLNQAQLDLSKHTDLSFDFIETKFPGSKKIFSITFFINKNSICENRGTTQKKKSQYLLQLLSTYDYEVAIIEKLRKTYGDLLLLETMKCCKIYYKNIQIKNKEGFLIEALRRGYFHEVTKKKVNRNKKDVEISDTEDLNHKNVSELEKEFGDNELRALLREFENKIMSNLVYARIYSEKGLRHARIETMWLNFLKVKLNKL